MIQCCVVWAYCVVRSYFCWWLSLVVWVCGDDGVRGPGLGQAAQAPGCLSEVIYTLMMLYV